MEKSSLLLASIVLLFAMLWLPLGQYDFLLNNWMKIGTYAIPFLLMGAFAFLEKDNNTWLSSYRFWAILLLIAYIVHQYEEHWIDLFGNYYAFYDFNNNFILGMLGATDTTIKPLTKESIFVINTSLVWLVGAMGIWRAPQHLFPAIAMASITVVNGVVHLLAAVANQAYNPGVVTSLVLFVPVYLLFTRSILLEHSAYKRQVWAGLIWAFLAHVLMVGGLLAANWFQLFPEGVYFVTLVIWSLIPVALYRNSR